MKVKSIVLESRQVSAICEKKKKKKKKKKGVDQLAHPRSLISAFGVRCLDSIHVIPKLAIAEISRH